MLRLPAVAGRFYPSDSNELTSLVREYSRSDPQQQAIPAKACLVPHAGYMYSGHVAGAVYARLVLPRKIIVLGVRHYPRGEPAAILSSGAWRSPPPDFMTPAATRRFPCAAWAPRWPCSRRSTRWDGRNRNW